MRPRESGSESTQPAPGGRPEQHTLTCPSAQGPAGTSAWGPGGRNLERIWLWLK